MAHTLLLPNCRAFVRGHRAVCVLRGGMVIQADENLLSMGAASSRAGLSQHFVHGVSPAMRALERTIADIAPTEIPILLVGESGTGKEVVALEIHRLSARWNEAFVKYGCSGVSADSIAARLQCANNMQEEDVLTGGSLFLDEINQLEPAAQGRLLNLLPDGSGAPSPGCLSVRV